MKLKQVYCHLGAMSVMYYFYHPHDDTLNKSSLGPNNMFITYTTMIGIKKPHLYLDFVANVSGYYPI